MVQSIKQFLRKEGIQRVTQDLLQKICFKVNNHTQSGKAGSAAERFLIRKPKSLFLNSMEREVDWRSMLEETMNEQTKLR